MGETRNWPLVVAGRPAKPNADGRLLHAWGEIETWRHAVADAAMIDQAIAAAERARPASRALEPWRRREALSGVAGGIAARREEFAQIIMGESGKPIRAARMEVDRAVETFRIASEEAVRDTGEWLDLGQSPRTAGTHAIVRRFPIGVATLFTPFNFPLNLVAHKVAPAIAAGCPFVLKPSPRTPYSALALGELLCAAELPEGAFSVLPCPNELAFRLVEDRRVSLVSFTGSSSVGWGLRARAGSKRVVLELGGNAACIVDADADAELAARQIVHGAFFQSGQSCISVQRVLLHEGVADEMIRRMVALTREQRSGDPSDEDVTVGPLIDLGAAERVKAWIDAAQQAGADILCGGRRDGLFVQPTILLDVPHDQPLWREEAFGPVMCIERFSRFEAALATVNESDYGLQAGVFTASMARVLQAHEVLEVGCVVINDAPSFRSDAMPYGGVKASGLGREGVRWAVQDMTELRTLIVRPSGTR